MCWSGNQSLKCQTCQNNFKKKFKKSLKCESLCGDHTLDKKVKSQHRGMEVKWSFLASKVMWTQDFVTETVKAKNGAVRSTVE